MRDCFMKRIIILSSILLYLCGCAEEFPESSMKEVDFTFSTEDTSADSRSILPETAAFENSIRNVVLILYDSATGLLETVTRTDGNTCSLKLIKGREYVLYAMANMGDMEGLIPAYENDISRIRYVIPDFKAMETQGLPMAGSMTFTADKASQPIYLRRLVAKVMITVDYSDMSSAGDPQGFSGGEIKVHRAAKALYPFAKGGSAAQTTDDIFQNVTDFQAVSNPLSPVSEELILYIPENMQGNLFGERVPADKFDNSLFTYISFEGSKIGTSDGVSGDIRYNFFPYGNDCENLDLEGGKAYCTSLTLTWNGMYIKGDWVVDVSSWNDDRKILLSANPNGPYSESIYIKLPPGVKEHPYYVFYTVRNLNYFPFMENGISRHKSYGWTFSSEGKTAADCNSRLSLSQGLSCGFSANEYVRSRHGISIPMNSSLINSIKTISYHTKDWRHTSQVSIKISAPTIELDKNEVVCSFKEYSSSESFSVTVIKGTVPTNYISVSCDNPLLHTGTFNTSTGSIKCYWTGQNDSDTQRLANLKFSGLGAEATCIVRQNCQTSLSVEEDIDAGEDYIEY